MTFGAGLNWSASLRRHCAGGWGGGALRGCARTTFRRHGSRDTLLLDVFHGVADGYRRHRTHPARALAAPVDRFPGHERAGSIVHKHDDVRRQRPRPARTDLRPGGAAGDEPQPVRPHSFASHSGGAFRIRRAGLPPPARRPGGTVNGRSRRNSIGRRGSPELLRLARAGAHSGAGRHDHDGRVRPRVAGELTDCRPCPPDRARAGLTRERADRNTRRNPWRAASLTASLDRRYGADLATQADFAQRTRIGGSGRSCTLETTPRRRRDRSRARPAAPPPGHVHEHVALAERQTHRGARVRRAAPPGGDDRVPWRTPLRRTEPLFRRQRLDLDQQSGASLPFNAVTGGARDTGGASRQERRRGSATGSSPAPVIRTRRFVVHSSPKRFFTAAQGCEWLLSLLSLKYTHRVDDVLERP